MDNQNTYQYSKSYRPASRRIPVFASKTPSVSPSSTVTPLPWIRALTSSFDVSRAQSSEIAASGPVGVTPFGHTVRSNGAIRYDNLLTNISGPSLRGFWLSAMNAGRTFQMHNPGASDLKANNEVSASPLTRANNGVNLSGVRVTYLQVNV